MILTNADPKTSLVSRSRLIQDQPVFNLELKGIVDKDGKSKKGVYPGPVTNQKSSGRCWLFATSQSSALSIHCLSREKADLMTDLAICLSV